MVRKQAAERIMGGDEVGDMKQILSETPFPPQVQVTDSGTR